MELVFDYSTEGGEGGPLDPSMELRRLEELAACFQQYVGHELVNRLVPIQAYARLLHAEPDGRLDADARELLDRLANLTAKADRHSRQVADLGRLLREPPWGPPTELRAVVEEVVTELRARRELPADLPTAVAVSATPVPHSRPLLHAVVTQLLRNAAAAVRPGAGDRIEVSGGAEPAGWWLEVGDTGRGMRPEQGKLLVEPFAASRVAPSAGLGLGFFLVRQAAALWHGRIRFHSTPDEGTTVRLFLPTLAPSPSDRVPRPAPRADA